MSGSPGVSAGSRVEPVRTCIGSRRRVSRSALLRIVVIDGRVVADPKAVMPGRGAWLTPTVEAYETALARRAFRRAFRLDREPDTSALLEYLRARADSDPAAGPNAEAGEQSLTRQEQAERLMDN
ncbi:YlxR family protein [Curtobacterium ammoniigenes]|uniref:YlxR family protein n=1 Tax=Curtobacterium ammoniigenes TaxID=395387 RepID=UPI00278BE2DE|nr:YlxR family protein [Curtobacterium ammoniigenes]